MALVERAINGQFRDIPYACSGYPLPIHPPDGWNIVGYPTEEYPFPFFRAVGRLPGALPCHLAYHMQSDGTDSGIKTTINAVGAMRLVSNVFPTWGTGLTIFLNGYNMGVAGGGDSGQYIDLSWGNWPPVCELKILCLGEAWYSEVLDSVSVLAEPCANFAPIWSLDIGPAMLPG